METDMTPSPTSTAEEMYAYWKSLAAPDELGVWTEDCVNFLFHHFRPGGDGVEKVFQGVVRGEEILPRLKEVYLSTAQGSVRENTSDAYFIVRQAEPLSTAQALEHCLKHLENMLRLLKTFREDGEAVLEDVSRVLSPLPTIQVLPGSAPDAPIDDDSPDLTLYEAICDLTTDLTYQWEHVDSHAFLLDDAFYYLACDYLLERYLTWPLFRDLTDLEEPFAPYFELWKHGAKYRFTDSRHVTVYVPNLVD
jgi:hypothetical protein